MADFAHAFARRTRLRGGDELTTILAGSPPGVLSMTGGFPNPATFPTDELDEIAARLVREDAAVALQYTPCEGIPSVREYLLDRQEQLQGRRPELAELIVTSGGMECIALMCQALIDPGDAIAVEAPTYLGALMAFGGAEADVGRDRDGRRRPARRRARRAPGRRPAPEVPLHDPGVPEPDRPDAAARAAPRAGRALPPARRADLRGRRLPRAVLRRHVAAALWSLGPDVVLQAGTFSKSFFPGVRLGWAAGPSEVVAELAAAKQNTDQCAGGLGQRMVEEYGRAGGFERHLPAARALYASHWAALSAALTRHMPEGVAWTEPTGGFLTWLTLPEELDTLALRPAAIAAGVAYVPGPPFHVGDRGRNTLRLSFSHLSEPELETAVERLAAVVRGALVPV